jgi:hypothetical protein
MVAAAIFQEIQRAIAEQAIEGFRVRARVAGEVAAIGVSEKAVAVPHGGPPGRRGEKGTGFAMILARHE